MLGTDLLVEAVPLVLSSRADVKFAIVGDGYMRADLGNLRVCSVCVRVRACARASERVCVCVDMQIDLDALNTSACLS